MASEVSDLISEENAQELILVDGKPLTELPHDLYIPPEALKVFLETFQGPLDLLLYLIKKQNLNILDIPVAEITRQYIQYVEIMKTFQLELAAEYLVMAALLTEIKSRLLLPRLPELEAEEEDPRAALVQRLQEYEQIKMAAENLDKLPQIGRDVFLASLQVLETEIPKPKPQIALKNVLQAFYDVMQRAALHQSHAVSRENLTVQDRMYQVLHQLKADHTVEFHQLFLVKEGKLGVVVTFIALLELLKQTLIDIIQQEPFSPMYVKAVTQ